MICLTYTLITSAIFFIRACTATKYVVYPISPTDLSKCTQTTRSLTVLLSGYNVRPYSSKVRQTTEFWLVQANDEQKARIVRLPFVKAVYEDTDVVEDCGTTYSKATEASNNSDSNAQGPSNAPFKWQTDASKDLNLISWPPRKALPETFRGYVYDVAGGIGTYIYVISNGINVQNPEFTKMPWPPTEWHYAPSVRHTQTDDSISGHGSCVASKAAGWNDGVSKNSRLVIMKASLTLADQHWAFSAALDDILIKRRQRRAVILYPRASTQSAQSIARGGGGGPVEMWIAIRNLIEELSRVAGTLTVVPAGNFALRSRTIDTFPGIWAWPSNSLSTDAPELAAVRNDNPSLLAVGSITNSGSQAPSSQGQGEPFLRFAPGEEVRCASGEPASPAQVEGSGTSFAAAMVAGLIAYTQTQTHWTTPADLVSKIRTRKLYSSPTNGNPSQAVWNGLNGAAKASQQNVSISSSSSLSELGLLNLTASA